ncbi:fungal-specific transcription factor domain-containing protein [Aspergillus heterothallicus]
MTTFAMLCEKQPDTRALILATESFIRLRGLVKPYISRRARLLHHMYTWMRILTKTQKGDQLQPPAEIEFGSVRIDHFLRIEPVKSYNNDLNIDEVKDTESGLEDIHLKVSRTFQGAMHMEIYGISETWLSLLSQTTRLANVLDRIRQQQQGSITPEAQVTLQRRATHLEDMICSFTSRQSSQGHAGNRLQQPMVRALNCALVLYFYRRVRAVNPCILQEHVTQIIDAIREFDAALASHGLEGPGTGWPAFMADCEAIGAERRDWPLQWVEQAGAKCRFPAWRRAREIMVEVWRRRDEGGARRVVRGHGPIRRVVWRLQRRKDGGCYFAYYLNGYQPKQRFPWSSITIMLEKFY